MVVLGLALGSAACGSDHFASGDGTVPLPSRQTMTAKKFNRPHGFWSRSEFCTSPVPRDYAGPLLSLPPIRRIPRSGRLPFAPQRLNIYLNRPGPVLTEGGDVGYNFSDRRFGSVLRLNWIVSAQLYMMSADGTLGEEIENSEITIGVVRNDSPPVMELKVPSAPGLYRFDIQFTDTEGNSLGEFSEYFRQMPVRTKVRLGINGYRFHMRQVVASRIENFGTSTVTYDALDLLQRRVGGRWRGVPQANHRAVPLFQGIIQAGEAGRCGSFRITRNLSPGRYRIVKLAGVPRPNHATRSLRLSADFLISR